MGDEEDVELPSFEEAAARTGISSSVRKDALIMAAEGEERGLRV